MAVLGKKWPVLGKKNCGCGEGLCDWVGTPVKCKYTHRILSPEELKIQQSKKDNNGNN